MVRAEHGDRAALLALRTPPFDHAPASEADRRRLAGLIVDRRSYWRSRRAQPPTRSDFDMIFKGTNGGLLTRSGSIDLVVWGVAIAVVSVAPRGWGWPLFVTLLGGAVLWVVMRFWREQTRGGMSLRVWRALSEPACPRCGYDLSGLDPLGTFASHGVATGPDACPECGTPWPLVPPAMPEEVTAQGGQPQ